MQIPTGNFGQAVAQPAQAISTPAPDVSSGVDALASTVGAIGNDYVDKQNGLKASLALATSQNALRDAHDNVSRGVLDGSIPADQAQQKFREQAQAIQSTNAQGLTRDHADMLGVQIAGLQGTYASSLNGTIIKRGQSETAATLDQFGEQVQRQAITNGDPKWASEKYGAMVDFLGGSTGLAPEQLAAKKQSFSEHTTAAYFDAKASNFLADGNLPGLTDTLHEVMGPGGDAMDPTKRAAITHQVLGYQNHLMAQQQLGADAAERARIARENAAADVFNQNRTVVENGAFLSPDAIKAGSDATAGTAMEKPWANLVASQAQVAGFASMPASQRAAALEHYTSEGADPTVGTTPDNQKQIQLMRNIDTKVDAAVKDNPWQAAQQYGVIVHAPVMDPTDPTAAADIVQQRMQQIGQVEQWVGHKISPMQPEEADRLAKSLRSLPHDQAASALSRLGQQIGDADRIDAFARQLGDKDGTLGLQMAYAGEKTNQGRYVAELIGRGAQALKDKTSTEDTAKQSGWRATAAAAIRGAFSDSQIESQAIDAAVKINAGTSLNGQDDMDSAIRMATGGIATHGTSDGKIPLPYGMSASDFEDKVKAISVADLAPQAQGASRLVDGKEVPLVFAGRSEIPLDTFVKSLPDATLVHAGQGLYNVRAGNQLVVNKDGKRITLKVGP